MSKGAFITWPCNDPNQPGGFAKCDPCKPTPLTYHLYIIGSTYNQPTPLVYVAVYASEPGYASGSGTIIVTALSSKGPDQSFSLQVSASGDVQAGMNAFGTPLFATDTGITVDVYTTSTSMTGEGDVIVSGGLAPSLYLVPPFTAWFKPKGS